MFNILCTYAEERINEAHSWYLHGNGLEALLCLGELAIVLALAAIGSFFLSLGFLLILAKVLY